MDIFLVALVIVAGVAVVATCLLSIAWLHEAQDRLLAMSERLQISIERLIRELEKGLERELAGDQYEYAVDYKNTAPEAEEAIAAAYEDGFRLEQFTVDSAQDSGVWMLFLRAPRHTSEELRDEQG